MLDGTRAVLKVALPAGVDGLSAFEQELETLLLAHGDPYVAVIRHDTRRRSMLLERLGQPLASLGWSISRQIHDDGHRPHREQHHVLHLVDEEVEPFEHRSSRGGQLDEHRAAVAGVGAADHLIRRLEVAHGVGHVWAEALSGGWRPG